jgi:hypothetical protein
MADFCGDGDKHLGFIYKQEIIFLMSKLAVRERSYTRESVRGERWDYIRGLSNNSKNLR